MLIALLCVLTLVCLLVIAAFIAARITVENVFGRYRKPARVNSARAETNSAERKPSRWALYRAENEAGREYIASLGSARRIEIMSHDGLKLSAVYIPAEKPGGKAAIVCHGHHASALQTCAMFARYYHERGFELIMPDLRGHGESEGKYIGFSYPDRLDLCAWSEKAIELFGEDCEIMLHGVSMGAASVVSAAGCGKLPKQVRCACSDCGFSSARKQFINLVKTRKGVSIAPLLPFLSLVLKARTGYSLGDVEPARLLENAKIPFVFMHGDADDYDETAMMIDFARACKMPYRAEIFEGAYHASCYPANKARYEALLDDLWERRA